MKHIATLAALILSAAGPVFAEDAKPKVGPSSNVAPSRPMNGGIMFGHRMTQAERDIEQKEKAVTLTDEQKERIKQIYDAREAELKAFHASIAEKMQAQQAVMMEAYKSKDQAKIAQVQAAYQAIYAPQNKIIMKSSAALEAVLTDEQRAKLLEYRFDNTVQNYAQGIQLSADQLEQIKEAAKQPTGDLEGFEFKLQDLISKALTAEQSTALLKMHAMRHVTNSYRNARLTAEQMQIVENRVADVLIGHPRKMQLEPSVYRMLTEMVDELLTDEQKEAMKSPRSAVYNGGFVPGAATNSAPNSAPSNGTPRQGK